MKMSNCPENVDTNDLAAIERFVTLAYNKASAASTVNEARLEQFAQKNKTFDTIPPTQEALRQQVKRAAYQGGWV